MCSLAYPFGCVRSHAVNPGRSAMEYKTRPPKFGIHHDGPCSGAQSEAVVWSVNDDLDMAFQALFQVFGPLLVNPFVSRI